ncbi:MAG TPA: hypothetical protein VFQ25_17765 [Ktedonobacterales bacterium]|nr:hypothetical protein [Ktedonobacterales bacterium]
MTPLIIAALLGLTAALIVAYPLLGLAGGQAETRETSAPSGLSEVAERERQARQALREVELDYTLGNLDSGDYDALRGRYERRALAALRTRYQREQELDALIERQLDALRAGKPSLERSADVSASATSTETATAKPAKLASSKTVATRAAAAPRVVRRAAPRDRRAPDKKGGA